MKNIVEIVMETDIMSSLVEDLTEEEQKDFKKWASDTLSPLNELAHIINDMSSTVESAERISEVVHSILSPEGFAEVEKCLEKS